MSPVQKYRATCVVGTKSGRHRPPTWPDGSGARKCSQAAAHASHTATPPAGVFSRQHMLAHIHAGV